MKYFSCHNHTVDSIKDAIATPEGYAKKIHDYNKSQDKHEILGFSVTEHSNLYSMVKYHQACTIPRKGADEKEVLKPIYGNEIYHVDDIENYKFGKSNLYPHLVLLAKTEEGLRNLIKITTHAGMHKHKSSKKDYQITDDIFLKENGKGIIALTACLAGVIPKLLAENKYDEAKAKALEMRTWFDDLYLEIQPHELPEQKIVNAGLLQISKETGIPLVITSDSHYVDKEDKKYHDIMKDIDNSYHFTTDNHFWTPDELIEWCNENNVPLEAIENTAKIYEECNTDITPKDARGLMPEYPCPKGYNENQYLLKMTNKGLRKKMKSNKYIRDNVDKYFERLHYEFYIISKMGFSGYFLILWDWFEWCSNNGVPTGPGRGSAAGSLISYALNITKVDPIRYGLYFERFLNEFRVEPPDIDTDICKLNRRKAIQYLQDKYGKEYVCQIMTFGKFKLRNTIKAVLSADRGFSADYQNSITKQIPDNVNQEPVTWEMIESYHDNPDSEDWIDLSERDRAGLKRGYEILMKVFEEYPEVYDALTHIAGATASVGMHAGGVCISSKPIGDHIALMKGSDTAVLPVCQTDMAGVTFFNILKIDALGLKLMSQIRLCMELTGLTKEWFESEDYFDEEVYKHLRDGNTTNVFQMQKYTPTKMIKDFEVDTIEKLSDVNAGNRPGPLAKDKDGVSMVDKYATAVDTGEITKIDPRIDWILEETKGCIYYQEQCMKLGEVMAGYPLGQADLRIRKTIAKKKFKEIPVVKNEFIYGKKSLYNEKGEVVGISDEDTPLCIGAINKGFTEELALKTFDTIEAFASYAFNKAHSLAYAVLGYKSAYLSYYHPLEWNLACLILDTIDGNDEKKEATINYCRKKGIKIRGLNINTSKATFSKSIENEEALIRYGFSAVKDVGSNVSEYITKLREIDGPFKSFEDFYNRTLNKKTYKTLEKLLIENNEYKVKIKETKKGTEEIISIKNPFSKRNVVPLILSGAFDCFNENRFEVYNEYVNLKKDKEELKDTSTYCLKEMLELELQYLGNYITKHPLDNFPYCDLTNVSKGFVSITGILKSYEAKQTKKKKKYYNLLLTCRDGSEFRANIFDSCYEKYPDLVKGLASKTAKEGKLIFIINGMYDASFNSITVKSATKILPKAEQEEVDKPSPTIDLFEEGV